MAANALKTNELATRSAKIITFPSKPSRNRLGVRERIEALQWVVAARTRGYARIEICNGPEPEIGDFLLIYEHDREWASWGISREEPDFCLWKTGARGMLARFPSLQDALAAVLEQPLRRRSRVKPPVTTSPQSRRRIDRPKADGGDEAGREGAD